MREGLQYYCWTSRVDILSLRENYCKPAHPSKFLLFLAENVNRLEISGFYKRKQFQSSECQTIAFFSVKFLFLQNGFMFWCSADDYVHLKFYYLFQSANLIPIISPHQRYWCLYGLRHLFKMQDLHAVFWHCLQM